jgi:hypothetical protein
MSDVFPKWANRLPRQIVVAALLVGSALTAGVTYYFTPKYTVVGYQPIQPVAFPHSVHAGQLGLDCRYCHNAVEQSWYANIPSASLCMNCHNQVLKDDPRLAAVRDSAATGRPVEWVQIHRTPDYVFFNHAVHVNRGVGCVECHGHIEGMDEVYHAKPLNMTYCLECHRHPATRLRPLDRITDMDWTPAQDPRDLVSKQLELGNQIMRDWGTESLQNCSTCHR